jgi:lipopolysaccharide exporter
MRLNRIYTWLRHPGESLSQRVVHAGFWAFALRITSRLFGLARTIVLARLLAPNDFGLYGIALLSLSALETFSQTGFDQALIQKKEDTKPYLDTAWTIQVIRGFVLGTLLVVGAPLVGAFFGEPRAVLLVRVLGAAVLLKDLRNIGIVFFRKELEFHKQFLYEFGGTFADLTVAIPAAFILRSVWALVFGLLAGNLVRMVMSYLVHPYRPSLQFEGAKTKELFTFGRWILGSSILVFLLTQGDDILLGKVLGVTALGLYQMAYRISNLPATEITHVVCQVTFPAYSKLQKDLPSLRNAFVNTVQVIVAMSFPLAVGIACLAPSFTSVFLGQKWSAIVLPMQVLAIWGLVRSLEAATGPAWQALGQPHVPMFFQFAKLILLGAFIYPFTIWWGVTGTAFAVAVESVIVHVGRYWFMAKTLNMGVARLFRAYAIPALASGAMAGVLFLIVKLVSSVTVVTFFLAIAGGTVMYCASFWILDKAFRLNTIMPLWHLLTRVSPNVNRDKEDFL